jgi:hypothetical protein
VGSLLILSIPYVYKIIKGCSLQPLRVSLDIKLVHMIIAYYITPILMLLILWGSFRIYVVLI